MPEARHPTVRATAASASRAESLALAALLAGALAVGSAGIFVRLSETGPTATAFWRGALALPLLASWAWIEAGRSAAGGRSRAPGDGRLAWNRGFFWAGLFFAGDLTLWHASLLLTSVAASTLEANLAPLFVTLIGWLLWRERPRPAFLIALALALLGVLLIVSPKLGRGGGTLLGDALGVLTAVFYAGYIVVVAHLRGTHGAGQLMFWSTLVFALLVLPLALTETFLPQTSRGWMLLLGLAVVAQFLGQGLIAFALAHLPATFGSVGLYVQPVAAALFAWLLLGEKLTAPQMLGGAVVLAAIGIARRFQRSRRA